MSVLTAIGLGLIVCGLAGAETGRLARHRTAGLAALGQLCGAADSATKGDTVGCTLCTTFAVALAWAWWNGGGDDDTKRGLRRLRRTFTPVRRTAPAPA